MSLLNSQGKEGGQGRVNGKRGGKPGKIRCRGLGLELHLHCQYLVAFRAHLIAIVCATDWQRQELAMS
jgi:hypothetical protein